MTTAANKATLWKLGKLSFSPSFQRAGVEWGKEVGDGGTGEGSCSGKIKRWKEGRHKRYGVWAKKINIR